MTDQVSFRLERDGAEGFSLRLVLDPFPRGRWLAIRYAADLYADPVRPVLRFERPGGPEDALMPGPVLGRGRWLGLVPADAAGLHLDPGTEGFRIEAVEVLTTASLLARCLARRPERAATALWFLARRNPRRFRDTLRGALATMPLDRWAAYAAERRRAPEPGFDRPRAEGAAVSFRLVIDVPEGAGAAAEKTLAALVAQRHADWRAALVGPGAAGLATDDARIGHLSWPPGEPAARALAALLDVPDPWLGVLSAGDALRPEALALIADRIAARPGARLVYADEEVGAGGGLAPRLKPAWSPDLARAIDYVGRPAFHAGLGPAAEAGSAAELEAALVRAVAEDSSARVEHLARVLCRRREALASPRRAPAWPRPDPAPKVSVVMPSRDRFDLVAHSSRGVLRETEYPDLELILVDNGSRDPAVLALYRELSADPRFRLVSWERPFDFSAMVNHGVSAATGAVLLLLNNDTAVLHPDWLVAMVRQAVRPDVGAVGCRLLYGDGRLQHAGVVVGLGGRAGHLLRRRPGDSRGRLRQLLVPHEVSAVTAACLAVARDKYEAVGGLDEAAFPIDFNDVDLCLRLAQRGWKTVFTPEATLSHLESVSRGPPEGVERARFEAEAARFTARWAEVIRDDPFYHPALSATTFGEELE